MSMLPHFYRTSAIFRTQSFHIHSFLFGTHGTLVNWVRDAFLFRSTQAVIICLHFHALPVSPCGRHDPWPLGIRSPPKTMAKPGATPDGIPKLRRSSCPFFFSFSLALDCFRLNDSAQLIEQTWIFSAVDRLLLLLVNMNKQKSKTKQKKKQKKVLCIATMLARSSFENGTATVFGASRFVWLCSSIRA